MALDEDRSEQPHLEKIQEQEENEIEYSRNLTINQEKPSPLFEINEKNNISEKLPDEEQNIPIQEPLEEEIVFINVYPNVRKEETTKKSGHSYPQMIKDENRANYGIHDELVEVTDQRGEIIQQEERKLSVPKPIFANNINEINQIATQEQESDENKRFRYSKMDEKTAEMLYKERFFLKKIQILLKILDLTK